MRSFAFPSVISVLTLFVNAGAGGAHTICSISMPFVSVVSAVENASESQSDSYPRVAAMEEALFGEKYPDDEIESRLGRLEKKAFGQVSSKPELSERTDELQQFVEKKLHRSLFKEDPQFESTTSADRSDSVQSRNDYGSTEQAQGGTPSKARAVGLKLGTTLLNVAGLGVPGFGGVRVRNRADLPPQEQAAAKTDRLPEIQEEPAIFEKEPPPGSAKLLTKVGWCEMRIFNRTFPSMHLPERLKQLNEELDFAPGKSGISLMDYSASMIERASRVHRQ